MPKIHEPINLIQSIPVKDAIGDGFIVLMMLIFKGSITTILIDAIIPKHHADAIGLIQEIKKLCLYDASSHWMVMAHDEKVSSSSFLL